MVKLTLVLLILAEIYFARGGEGQPEVSPSRSDNVAGRHMATAQSAGVVETVSVAELGDRVEVAKRESDEDAAKEIGHLELTERLSSPSLASLIGELNGAQSKAALMAVGDASAFLEPPQKENLDKAAPDAAEQIKIVSRAMDYLKSVVLRLPDFYATRITNVFEQDWTIKEKRGSHDPGPLNFKGKFVATAVYRNGKEVVHAKGAAQGGLITQGTFGPVLSGVIVNELRSPLQWHGWEKGPNGIMADFIFRVPQKDSQFGVSFPMGGLATVRRTGYQGEIGIDPDTGTILRVTLRSDAVVGLLAVEHVNIMLEYGPVIIGGETYTCAVRGVSMSTARYQQKGIHGREEGSILLDDVLFTDYHVFRSEMRILPN